MKLISRCLLVAVCLVPICSSFASNPAPGILVQARNGGAVAWQGITDSSGKFMTAPLQPGIYTFELRVPKTIATPARYALVLGGARPISDATSGEGAALRLNAEVRSTNGVRGQVTARRVVLVPAQSGTSTSGNSATTRAAAGVSGAAPVSRPSQTSSYSSQATDTSGLAPRPVGYQPRMINGRPHVWVPIAPGTPLGRWVPARRSSR